MMNTMPNPHDDPETSLREKYRRLLPHLNQQQTRLVLAADANDLTQHGHPDSINIIARAAHTTPATIRRGITELNTPNTPN